MVHSSFPAGVTTWSVVKDDSGDERRRGRLPRTALFVCLALVVVTLGMVLRPGNPAEPPQPPVSERARAAALADALRLRTASGQLGAGTAAPAATATPDAARPALDRTVSLLTTQARALLRPGQAGEPPATAATATPSAATAAAAPGSAAALAADLAASGRQRLADAAAADGGMARLLAAVGTAQLLQSSGVAAAAGAPDPAAGAPDAGPAAGPAVPTASATAAPTALGCPAPAATPSDAATGSTPAASAADLGGALAALIRTELETVYGYQVALTRLDGGTAKAAADQLARHEALATAAEALSRANCVPVPAPEAGYALDPAFLAAPGAGLGALEAGSLSAYGDLVALSNGTTRQWAVSGLLEAARRASLWGADAGALPGLPADPASFPTLPAG